MAEKLTFEINVPVQVALREVEGTPVEGRFGDQVMYRTVDGRPFWLDVPVAAKINALEVRAREAFMICRRWSGKKGDPMKWDVWRPDAASAQPAPPVQPEAGVSAPAPVAAVSKAQPPGTANNGNGSTPANGNGKTNGNGQRVYVPCDEAGYHPPTKIPMDEAVIDAVRIVRRAMEATGEQWSDASKQGLVSTILIAAERQGWLACWKREVTQ